MMTATEFSHDRADAIKEYSTGRNGWTVLGLGVVGSLGAVRIQDQHGEEGLVVQSFEGAEIGAGRSALTGYYETSAFV